MLHGIVDITYTTRLLGRGLASHGQKKQETVLKYELADYQLRESIIPHALKII